MASGRVVPYQDFSVQTSLEKLEDTLPVLGEAGIERRLACVENHNGFWLSALFLEFELFLNPGPFSEALAI